MVEFISSIISKITGGSGQAPAEKKVLQKADKQAIYDQIKANLLKADQRNKELAGDITSIEFT